MTNFVILVIVPRTTKNDHGGRIYNKAHSCLYCESEVLKIARHLEHVHCSEPEVRKILAMDKKDISAQQRPKSEFERLRLKGNFYHNIRVLKCGGELKVLRRPAEGELISYKQFVPCVHCLGFVQKTELWRHVAHCQFNDKCKDEAKNRKLQYESELLLFGSKDLASQDQVTSAFREHVIAIMRVDEISLTAKTDELIFLFGKSQFEKGGSAKAIYISQNMRSLARLLIQLQKTSTDKSKLTDFISPMQFDCIIEATKVLCSHNIIAENDHLSKFDRPSLALKIGNQLKRCASILRGIALRKKDTALKEDAEAFIDLMDSEWGSKISSAALRNLNDNTFNKAPILPVTADLLKIREYLLDEIPKTTKELSESPSLEKWRILAELSASRIILFNKRRGNEGTKLEIKQFQERPKWSEQGFDEMTRSLEPLELELCKRYVRRILYATFFFNVFYLVCASWP